MFWRRKVKVLYFVGIIRIYGIVYVIVFNVFVYIYNKQYVLIVLDESTIGAI